MSADQGTHPEVDKWRRSLRYLPRFLRDFHDQKETFKAMHSFVDVQGHDYAKEVNWIAGQCYVIDIFLWHMARHGWVLRRADAKLPFHDLEQTNSHERERARAASARALGLTPINGAESASVQK